MRLLESSIREVPLELAAGCSALLGTDGLVVLMSLPIREVRLELILLLVFLVERFVITLLELLKFKLLLLELLTLDVPLLELLLFVIALLELLLLDGVLVVIVLPILDVMLELILPFELFCLLEFRVDVRELIGLLEILVPGVLFVTTLLELLLLDTLLVMALPDVVLLGVRFVMALLELLMPGARFVMVRLDVLLPGALLVTLLLEMFALGVLLVTLLLDETLLGRLDEFALGVALGAGAGLDTCRLCRLELFDLLLDRDLAPKTGSRNNKNVESMQKTRKSGLFRRDLEILTSDL